LAGIQFDGAPFVTAFSPELAKRARMLHRNVLENQNAHDGIPFDNRPRQSSMKEGRAGRKGVLSRPATLVGKEVTLP
jgi:hypothetical protein